MNLVLAAFVLAALPQWPQFRGPLASGRGDGAGLPDTWSAADGQNVAWRTPIAGLAHSSPIVWGDRVFVTTAISSRKDATFKPGLYSEGRGRKYFKGPQRPRLADLADTELVIYGP